MDKINNSLPNMAPEGPLGTQNKGLLSAVGDPVGQVLDKSLRPTLGAVTGAVGNPNGEALERVKKVAKYENAYGEEDREKPDSEKPGGERIGGNQQTGGNPLGL